MLVLQRKSSALLERLIAERHRFEKRGLEMQTAEVGVRNYRFLITCVLRLSTDGMFYCRVSVESCGLCCVQPPDIRYEFTKGDMIGNKCIDSVRD